MTGGIPWGDALASSFMLAGMKTMAGVNITPSENGPYLVSGAVRLADGDGREVPHGEHLALCRCGHAKNKPFCDGMHLAICFDGTLKH